MTGTGAVRHEADRERRVRRMALAAAAAAQSTEASPSPDASSGPPAPGAGPSTVRPQVTGPLRDGDLEFTVTGVRTGVGPLGEGAVQRRPVGQFVLVTVEVRNRGQERVQFDVGSQLMAGAYLKEAASFQDPIEGGRRVTGVVVFDLPAGVLPTAVSLRGPDSSEGVSVPLG